MRINLLLRPGVALLVLASAFSQTQNSKPVPAQESADMPLLRVTVNLVQVDAVVTDSKGNQITNLTADDFLLLQDGKPQKITHFSYISTAAPAAAPIAPPRVTPVKGIPAPPPLKLRPDQIRRTVAMVVDDLGLSFESMAQIRSALKKFVDQQMQPGDLVAIIRTGAGMGALQQFTSDKHQLYAAIDRVKYNPMGRGGVGAFAPVGGEAGGSAVANDFRDEYFTRGTIGALNFVIAGLKEMPGRKAVVLLSDSIRLFNEQGLNDIILESMRQLTDAANRASVVIYGIDARGLPTLSLTAEDNPKGRGNLTGPGLAKIQQQRHEDYFRSQDGLNYLAQETGGLFVHDTNDIAGGMRKVLDDQRGYYLLGYTPDDATFQQLKDKKRQYHKLSVKLKKPGLSIRSRTGFFGVPDQNAKPVYRTREEQLFAALGSPFGGGAVHLRLTALFANNPKEGPFVQSLLHIEGHDLTFIDEPDDWHKAVVDILLVTFSDSGVEMDQSSKTITVRLHGAAYRDALKHGFVYTVNHPVKKPGAYQMRTAVRDAATEKIGSASQFIEVPDLSKGHLTLSGLVVRASRPAAPAAAPSQQATPDPSNPVQAKPAPALSEQAQREETDIESLGNPAVRIFRPGRRLDYALQILNSQEDAATKRPQLETQLLLFHDGKQIYAGKPKPLEQQQSTDIKSVVTAGQLQLGSKMEPGEYAMQIVVTDKLAKEKYRTVAQSIDFEVVK
jgi:VWFA-related protein